MINLRTCSIASAIKVICILAILTVGTGVQAQSSKDVVIDKLLTANKTKEISLALVKTVIIAYKEEYPKVPVPVWEDIQQSISFSSYINAIKQAYNTSYTEKEIVELTNLYKPSSMDTYKEKNKRVEQKLYDAGKQFGREIGSQITRKLNALGYRHG